MEASNLLPVNVRLGRSGTWPYRSHPIGIDNTHVLLLSDKSAFACRMAWRSRSRSPCCPALFILEEFAGCAIDFADGAREGCAVSQSDGSHT